MALRMTPPKSDRIHAHTVQRYVAQYEKSLAQYPNIKPGEEFTGYKTALPKSA
jgi:hypothetical protein